MSEKAAVTNSHDVLSITASTDTPPRVLNQEQFSPEDELILFTVLQDIAKELRRIKRERKKHQEETEH